MKHFTLKSGLILFVLALVPGKMDIRASVLSYQKVGIAYSGKEIKVRKW